MTSRTRELAEWCLRHMVARTTAYGQYTAKGKSYTAKEELTLDVLDRHFAGETTIGIHVIGLDNMCRFVAWDIDNHDGSKEVALSTRVKAIVLIRELRAVGAKPVFEDSDGRGSYHVWVIFDRPVEAQRAHAWARSVAPAGTESFPKQPKINPEPGAKGHFGNFIRLPGRHHKRDHWSRFRDGEQWWDWEDGTELLRDCEFFDADLVPDVPEPQAATRSECRSDSARPRSAATDGARTARSTKDRLRALDCLQRIEAARADDYHTWLKVGMALHHVDPGPLMLAAWDAWSAPSPKYQEGVCEAKWASFGDGHASPVTLATLIHLAGGDAGAHLTEQLEQGSNENEGEKGDLRDTCLDYLGGVLGRPVARWQKLAGETPIYTLVLNGPSEEITVGTAAVVRSFKRFADRLYDHGVFLEPAARNYWPSVTRALLAIVEEVENPEGGREARVFGAVEAYLRGSTVFRGEEWHEGFPNNHPFVRDAKVHVHVATMRNWLARRLDDRWPRELAHNDLRAVGFAPISVSHASWRTSRSYWAIRLDDAGDRLAHLDLKEASEEEPKTA